MYVQPCLYGNCDRLSVHFNFIFTGGPRLASTECLHQDFIGAKDDEGCGDNWSYKTCKAPVISSPTNPTQAGCLSVVQPTVSEH